MCTHSKPGRIICYEHLSVKISSSYFSHAILNSLRMWVFPLTFLYIYINNIGPWTSHWKGLVLRRKGIWILDLCSSAQDGGWWGGVQGHWLKLWQLDHLVCNPMWIAESVGEAIIKFGFPLILLYSGDWSLVTGKQIQWPSRGSLHYGWVKPQIPSISLGTMFLSEAPEGKVWKSAFRPF